MWSDTAKIHKLHSSLHLWSLMLNITAHRCLATSNCLVKTLIRLRDNVITKRCQDSHSIIEKLKVQFYYCVAIKDQFTTYSNAKTKFRSWYHSNDVFSLLTKLWLSLVLDIVTRQVFSWMFGLFGHKTHQHGRMAASLIQRHKLKIKTLATKNLSVSYTALWLFTTLESVIEWLLRTVLLNIERWKY